MDVCDAELMVAGVIASAFGRVKLPNKFFSRGAILDCRLTPIAFAGDAAGDGPDWKFAATSSAAAPAFRGV